MQISDQNASVVKAATWQVTNRIESIKWSLDRVKSLSKRFCPAITEKDFAEIFVSIEREIKNSEEIVRELLQYTSLMYWRLKPIAWPHGQTWNPAVGDRLIGQVIQYVCQLSTEYVIVQKEQGELITVYFSHVDLSEKFERLKPVVAKRIVIERLPNHGRKYRYFVEVIPWSAKVA